MKSVVEQIIVNASLFPQKIALVEGKRKISYSELVKGILFAKYQLTSKYGLSKGNSVILAANKQISFVYVYFAAHLSGITVVPIDLETNVSRFEIIKAKVCPKLVIGFDLNCQSLSLSLFDGQIEDELSFGFPDDESVADIIFTTGTTGIPKGVLLTHKNIASATHNINTFIRNGCDDIELLALPISHSFGLGRLRCSLTLGATLVLLGSFVNVKRFYCFMEEYKITGLAMVPASWAFLKKMSGMKLFDYADQLKYVEIGSAPMCVEDKLLLMQSLPTTRICMHYGLTEAPRSTFLEFHADSEYLDSVGKPSPNMEVVIKDENGQNCECLAEGEICVKGDAVTKGYLGVQDIDANFYWNGYFRTGDWGMMDSSGYLYLKSRKKELINVGGKKVSPVEVEEVLKQLAGITDCACVAIPDPNGILGEVVRAYVVFDNNHPHLSEINSLIGNRLEVYKQPVEYIEVENIPKTGSGKVQRLLLNMHDYVESPKSI
ncbi:class I adenylate-forming enzyme family protein [uncultured Parabacteroides sp.]|uniref:class I adenylate-forming enzyme family protein n=1 Tax=uncultured Parabacteroides sp. TaxID=512312 RepID=UPI0025EA136A|nr:class I adenylate-forming enzyme family protein [uncultured Parabacteroides sp.]